MLSHVDRAPSAAIPIWYRWLGHLYRQHSYHLDEIPDSPLFKKLYFFHSRLLLLSTIDGTRLLWVCVFFITKKKTDLLNMKRRRWLRGVVNKWQNFSPGYVGHDGLTHHQYITLCTKFEIKVSSHPLPIHIRNTAIQHTHIAVWRWQSIPLNAQLLIFVNILERNEEKVTMIGVDVECIGEIIRCIWQYSIGLRLDRCEYLY